MCNIIYEGAMAGVYTYKEFFRFLHSLPGYEDIRNRNIMGMDEFCIVYVGGVAVYFETFTNGCGDLQARVTVFGDNIQDIKSKIEKEAEKNLVKLL